MTHLQLLKSRPVLNDTSLKVREVVIQYWTVHHVPPSLRKVADLVPCSLSTVYYHLRRLEKAGWMKRVDRRPLPVEVDQFLSTFGQEGGG